MCIESGNEVLRVEMTKALERVISFTQQIPFRTVMAEMMALAPPDRAQFVLDVWLSPAQLRARGLEAPDDLIIQRSAFRDERPTLFCVTKYLPPGLAWQKVTVTIDNAEGRPAVSYNDLAATSATK